VGSWSSIIGIGLMSGPAALIRNSNAGTAACFQPLISELTWRDRPCAIGLHKRAVVAWLTFALSWNRRRA
jgi:hypothetical protein